MHIYTSLHERCHIHVQIRVLGDDKEKRFLYEKQGWHHEKAFRRNSEVSGKSIHKEAQCGVVLQFLHLSHLDTALNEGYFWKVQGKWRVHGGHRFRPPCYFGALKIGLGYEEEQERVKSILVEIWLKQRRFPRPGMQHLSLRKSKSSAAFLWPRFLRVLP